MTFNHLTETAQAPTSTTSQILHCPTSVVLGRPLQRRLPQRSSCKRCLALSCEHHRSQRHTSHVSMAARSRRLPHQSTSPILNQSLSNTAPPALCWAALCGEDCPSVLSAKSASLCLVSTTSLDGTRRTSLRRPDLVVCLTNHRRLSLSSL